MTIAAPDPTLKLSRYGRRSKPSLRHAVHHCSPGSLPLLAPVRLTPKSSSAINMPEFTKAQRKVLRELAAQVYEADARAVLGQLENDFVRWRADEMESSELLEAIHQFHQVQSRELWSRYQSLKDPEIVARGIACGLLSPTKLPEALVAELATLIDLFARHKG